MTYYGMRNMFDNYSIPVFESILKLVMVATKYRYEIFSKDLNICRLSREYSLSKCKEMDNLALLWWQIIVQFTGSVTYTVGKG